MLNTMHSLSHSIASVRERLTLSPPSSLHEISPDSIAIAMSPTNAHVASTSTANVFIQSLVETAEVGSQMQFPIFRMTAVAHDAEANVFTHEMKLPNPSNLLERGHIRSSAKNKAFFESQFNNHGIRVLTFASERKLRHSFISSSPHGPPKSMTLLFELEANMDDRYDTSNKASSKFEIDAQTRSVLTGAVRLKMGSEIFFCIKSPSRAASTFGSWDSDDFVHSNVFKLELNSSKLANSKAGFYVTINDLSFDLISSISTISRQDCLLSLTQSAT